MTQGLLCYLVSSKYCKLKYQEVNFGIIWLSSLFQQDRELNYEKLIYFKVKSTFTSHSQRHFACGSCLEFTGLPFHRGHCFTLQLSENTFEICEVVDEAVLQRCCLTKLPSTSSYLTAVTMRCFSITDLGEPAEVAPHRSWENGDTEPAWYGWAQKMVSPASCCSWALG